MHSSIRDQVWSQYLRGEFDVAIHAAMKAVEVAVRAASGLENEIGKTLMRKAFAPCNAEGVSGPLTDRVADTGEQDGMSALFSGAIQVCKNPQSHRHVAITDPDEAAEIIMLACYLLRVVDRRKQAIVEGWFEEQ